MPNNSITKLPRSVLAKITGGDNQAIKAFENMEFQALSLPEQVAYLASALTTAQLDIIYATKLANEALDEIKSLQRLPPIAVQTEQHAYLPPVGHEAQTISYLSPVRPL